MYVANAFKASSSLCSSALTPLILAKEALNFFLSFSKIPSIVQYSTGTKASISFSLSTISFKATLCTRPADLDLILLFKSLDNLKPIILSSIRLVY